MPTTNLDPVVETLLKMFSNIVEYFWGDKVTLVYDTLLQVL